MNRFSAVMIMVGVAACTSFSSTASAQDVPRFGLFEIKFTTDEKFDNPFWDPVVKAEFVSPAGNRAPIVKVAGFYYGGNEWRVRFAPGTEGKWTWAATMTFRDKKLQQQGEFNCVKGTSHGFLRISKVNPFRFEYDDGTPFYPIGYQTGGLLKMGHDGPDAGTGKWRSVELEEYLKDFDGAANLQRLQLGCGDKEGMAFQILTGTESPDRYDTENAAKLDEAYRLYRKYNVSQILILFQDMSTYGNPKTVFGAGRDTVGYKNVNAPNMPLQEKYLRYMVARYAAFVDVWEIFNEDSFAPDDYLAHLAKVIRDADPYRRLITTNYERPDQPWCDVVCPHEYMSIPAKDVDGHLIEEFVRLKAWGKPVQYTEFGNKGTLSNYDPEKWRIVVWTCFTREVGMLFWSMSGTKTTADPKRTAGNSNTYLGPDTRKHFRILQEFCKDLPADMRPVHCLATNHDTGVHVGGLSNGSIVVLYVHHFTDHDTEYQPRPVTVWTGPGRFKVKWIDPATGETVREEEKGTAQNFLTISVPPLKVDLACRLDRMK